jgi:hypothetical protein
MYPLNVLECGIEPTTRGYGIAKLEISPFVTAAFSRVPRRKKAPAAMKAAGAADWGADYRLIS